MPSKQGNHNQIAFALKILQILAQGPMARKDLCDRMAEYLKTEGETPGDIQQKVTRTIKKLKECGFDIYSAPNRPYELIESKFPVILSKQQQQALAIAAYFLESMGFAEPASQLIGIGDLDFQDLELGSQLAADFNPPMDYSQNDVRDVVSELRDRLERQCRFAIRYCSSGGNCQVYDIDRSQLRLHDGVLYLFAFVPDWKPQHIDRRPNAEQNIAFRVDRIEQVRPPSQTPWCVFDFPTLEVRYRMSGPLRHYQPRRSSESEVYRDRSCVEIITKEDCVFWLRQRLLRYGANVRVLEPDWLAKIFLAELRQAYKNYSELEESQ